MALDTLNEGSTGYLTVAFTDKDGAAATPSTVSYRIDCMTNGQEVKDDTAVTPASSVKIELGAADNAIIDQANPFEKRIVTVTADYGVDDACVDEFIYAVKNMQKKT